MGHFALDYADFRAVCANGYAQNDQASAKEQLRHVVDELKERFPKAMEILEEAEDDILAYMAFPHEHWAQICSTNPLERLNREIRRRDGCCLHIS